MRSRRQTRSRGNFGRFGRRISRREVKPCECHFSRQVISAWAWIRCGSGLCRASSRPKRVLPSFRPKVSSCDIISPRAWDIWICRHHSLHRHRLFPLLLRCSKRPPSSLIPYRYRVVVPRRWSLPSVFPKTLPSRLTKGVGKWLEGGGQVVEQVLACGFVSKAGGLGKAVLLLSGRVVEGVAPDFFSCLGLHDSLAIRLLTDRSRALDVEKRRWAGEGENGIFLEKLGKYGKAVWNCK